MVEFPDEKMQLHKEHIESVALEVSQSRWWRKLLFSSNLNQKFLINSTLECEIPRYIKCLIAKYQLQFYVSKVTNCPEKFDPNAVIFKFEAAEFTDIIRFSGNHLTRSEHYPEDEGTVHASCPRKPLK